MCIYESLLFHPKIFSMSTCSKHGDMNRALQRGREKEEVGNNMYMFSWPTAELSGGFKILK